MDAIRSVEEKINKNMQFNDEKGIERLEKTFKEMSARVNQTNQFFNDKIDDVRKVLSTYDSRLNNVATNAGLEKV
jgi:hypothetical protein